MIEPLVVVKAIVTAYCWCVLCTGHTHGITKSGVPAKEGITVACSREMLNHRIYIVGLGTRTCHDTGSAIKGNRIDIYFDDHQEALEFGKKRMKVYRMRK